MFFLNTLVVNLAGPPRREAVDGREYLIAPLAMIVPGVLSGSKGALYYPPDEVAKSAAAWDGVPLTLDHPYHPTTGAHLSASAPGVLDRQGVGVVRRPRMAGGKLVADGWFDVERTRRVAPRVLRDLEAGRPVEISTGLYTINEPARPGVHFNGRGYDYVAREYRPDHLAVLPDQIGACSIRDGCGANIANARRPRRPCSCSPCSTKTRGTNVNDLLPLPTDNYSPAHTKKRDGLDYVFAKGDRVEFDVRRKGAPDETRVGTITGQGRHPTGATYALVEVDGEPLPVRVGFGDLRPARGKKGEKRRAVANVALRGADPMALPTENALRPSPSEARSAFRGADPLPY